MTDHNSDAEETDQALKERHDELSKDIRKTALLVVSYSFFCFLALGQSDEVSVSETLQLQIPFANTGINPKTFLFIGPLLLILLTSYLHIFIREWSKVDVYSIKRNSLPYIFNLKFWFARILTVFTFYVLPIIVLLGFAASTRAHPYFWYQYILVVLMAIVMLLCFLTHKNRFPRRVSKLSFVILATILLVGFICIGHGSYYISKPLFLKNAKLSKNDLSNYNLKNAFLTGAQLIQANLEWANLEWAWLDGANLSQARLSGANLGNAFLVRTDLTRASLGGTDLGGANLFEANLEGAGLIGAKFIGASLMKANLRGADLRRANLEGAHLAGADLIGANLFEANFKGADFIGRDLTEQGVKAKVTKITCEQIQKAKVYENTRLPEHLKNCKINRLKNLAD